MDLLLKITLGSTPVEEGKGSRKKQREKLSCDAYPVSALANGMDKP